MRTSLAISESTLKWGSKNLFDSKKESETTQEKDNKSKRPISKKK